jgi:hypothetical protein
MKRRDFLTKAVAAISAIAVAPFALISGRKSAAMSDYNRVELLTDKPCPYVPSNGHWALVSKKSGSFDDPTVWERKWVPCDGPVMVINDGHVVECPIVSVGA